MRFISILLDNWWLIFMGYAIWRAVAKKAARATAEREKVVQAVATLSDRRQVRDTREAYFESSTVEADGDDEDREDENKRVYAFQSPVQQEEEVDRKERLAAFAFVPSEEPAFILRADAARRELARLNRIYGPAGVSQPSAHEKVAAFSAQELQRALVMNEILGPPRSRRSAR